MFVSWDAEVERPTWGLESVHDLGQVFVYLVESGLNDLRDFASEGVRPCQRSFYLVVVFVI